MFKIQFFKSLLICVICYFICVICGYTQDPKEPSSNQGAGTTQSLTPLTPIPIDGSIDRIISKLPPPAYFSFYNLLSNGSFESWTESILDNWSEEGLISQSADKYLGSFSLTLTDISNISQDYSGFSYLKDKQVIFGCWVKPTSLDQVKLSIDDGTETFSGYNTTTDNWEFLTLTKKINPEAAKLTIKIINDKEGTTTLIDAACLYEITPQGSICFTPNPTDNIQMPANLIYTDLEYKKVGIGLIPDTQKDYKLDVAGSLNALDIYLDNSPLGLWKRINDTEIYFDGQKVGIGMPPVTNALEVSGNVKANKFLLSDDTELTAGLWTKKEGTEDIYYDLGNVGIGIDSPDYKFHVEGEGDVALLARTTTDNTGVARIRLEGVDVPGVNGGALQWVESPTGSFLNLNTYSGVRPLVLQTFGGRVGIGTTAPGSTLDIRGITEITDDGATPDTSRYASFGITRTNAAINNTYIGLTKTGVVPWGIGIDAGSSLIFGLSSVSPAKTIPTPLLTITNTGNVGIGAGMTEVGARLHIASPASGSETMVRFDAGGGSHLGTLLELNAYNALNMLHLRQAYDYADENIILYEKNTSLSDGIPTTGLFVLKGNGNVGIGTTEPAQLLSLYDNTASPILQIDQGGGDNAYDPTVSFKRGATAVSADIFLDSSYGSLNFRNNFYNAGGESGRIYFLTRPGDGDGSYATAMAIRGNGNVGIGREPGSYKLDVAGSINIDGNINAKYQDVAEWVESDEKLTAGSVVVIDPSADNRVLTSSSAYDTKVCGVVSHQPGLSLGEKADNKYQISHTGRVKVKVDASFGKISRGDLLVTSPKVGVAMKYQSKDYTPGVVLGKALEPLDEGEGEILVLLSLQ